MPPPVEINEGRENKRTYLWFCENFLEPVIGTAKWKANKCKQQVRKFVTPSDEAFAVLVYENNYRKWYECFYDHDPKNRTEKALWTSGSEQNRHGHSNKKFCGWAREGLEHFNDVYKKVEKDRKGVPGFEKSLLQHLLEEYEKANPKTNRKKTIEATDEMAGFEILTSLPFVSSFGTVVEESCGDDDGSVSVEPV